MDIQDGQDRTKPEGLGRILSILFTHVKSLRFPSWHKAGKATGLYHLGGFLFQTFGYDG